MEWIAGIAFGISNDILQQILDKPEVTEMRRALLDSFLRHSLPKKTLVEPPTKHAGGSAPDLRRNVFMHFFN